MHSECCQAMGPLLLCCRSLYWHVISHMQPPMPQALDIGNLNDCFLVSGQQHMCLSQGKERSMSLDASSIDEASVPDSEPEVVEPGGSTPSQQLHPPLHLTEGQSSFFSQLPSFRLPNGCQVYRVQSTLPTLEGLVCTFDTNLCVVSGMQSMLG